jgi:hypothetical protein
MADPSKFYGLLVLATGRTVAPKLLPELHLNIWEKKSWGFFESAFLDVGVMLDATDTAQTLEFVLPWSVKNTHLEDLSLRLQERGATPAIFNESWVSSASNGGAGLVTDPVSKEIFTVVETHGDLLVYEHNKGTKQEQHSIRLNIPAIKKKAVTASATAKRMYVRFRVKDVPRSFYRVSLNPRDWIFLSSWQRTEIIDFRMNVRRGVPVGFEQLLNGTFLEFSKVHLFLMKSRAQDIVFEDKWFRSCRSLEDEHFWAGYSLANNPNDWQRFWSRQRVKSSLGYQWTKVTDKNSATGAGAAVKEFGTLARFKDVRFGIIKFIVVAGLVGATGNMFWDAVKYRYETAPIAGKVQEWLTRAPNTGNRE